MIIDCERCTMRDLACADCVVSHFLHLEPTIERREERALAVLHDSGLVPPLRMQAGERATG